jgi:hypothetical protein
MKNSTPHASALINALDGNDSDVMKAQTFSSITLLGFLLMVLQLSPAYSQNRSSHPLEGVNSISVLRLFHQPSVSTLGLQLVYTMPSLPKTL